ncbi:hypothetical protein DFP72DRAFT_847723 [Ephemerocybe angulata]|uniref:C2H2-type domain-containing protein n=1 Tax=Ephemerocybe angulata TaxID=980116 RepID=A0A8H6HZH9_9AGAR|nr:hypothetical protein DFP72DRAFT_847723 [Tulosesus angulatus]
MPAARTQKVTAARSADCVCNICGHDLNRPADLERHKAVHLPRSERPFKCMMPLVDSQGNESPCPFAANQKGGLKTHQNSRLHLNVKKPCGYEGCTFECTDDAGLCKHRQKKHNILPKARAMRAPKVETLLALGVPVESEPVASRSLSSLSPSSSFTSSTSSSSTEFKLDFWSHSSTTSSSRTSSPSSCASSPRPLTQEATFIIEETSQPDDLGGFLRTPQSLSLGQCLFPRHPPLSAPARRGTPCPLRTGAGRVLLTTGATTKTTATTTAMATTTTTATTLDHRWHEHSDGTGGDWELDEVGRGWSGMAMIAPGGMWKKRRISIWLGSGKYSCTIALLAFRAGGFPRAPFRIRTSAPRRAQDFGTSAPAIMIHMFGVPPRSPFLLFERQVRVLTLVGSLLLVRDLEKLSFIVGLFDFRILFLNSHLSPKTAPGEVAWPSSPSLWPTLRADFIPRTPTHPAPALTKNGLPVASLTLLPSSSAPTHTLHTPIPRRRRSPDAILLRLGVLAPRSRYVGQPAPSLNSKSKSEFVSSSEMPLAGRVSIAFGQFRRQHTRFSYALVRLSCRGRNSVASLSFYPYHHVYHVSTIITDTSSISLRADLKPSASQSPTDGRFRPFNFSIPFFTHTSYNNFSNLEWGCRPYRRTTQSGTSPGGPLAGFISVVIPIVNTSCTHDPKVDADTDELARLREFDPSMYTWGETWASETPSIGVNGTPLLSYPLAGFISVVFSTFHHWIVGSLERLTLPKPDRSTGDGARDIYATLHSRGYGKRASLHRSGHTSHSPFYLPGTL